jgi:hypothetical protein
MCGTKLRGCIIRHYQIFTIQDDRTDHYYYFQFSIFVLSTENDLEQLLFLAGLRSVDNGVQNRINE